jgi:hypothetical protein
LFVGYFVPFAKICNIYEINKESGKFFVKYMPDPYFEMAWGYQSQSYSINDVDDCIKATHKSVWIRHQLINRKKLTGFLLV